MRYGTTKETKTTDENGSTITTEKHIVDFKISKPIRKYYAIKVKVKDKKDEMTEYLKFSDSLDEKKKDPSFSIERTKYGEANGFYYVVKAWTELHYEDI